MKNYIQPLTVIEHFEKIRDLASEHNFDAQNLFYDQPDLYAKHSAKYPWDESSQTQALDELKKEGEKKYSRKILIAQIKDIAEEYGNESIQKLSGFLEELN